MTNQPIRIFISYSHENKIWLTQYLDPRKNETNPRYLLDFWERSLRGKGVEFWYDRDETQGIRGGDKWRTRIFEEIDHADIAILLITQDFVISPFIRDEELPHILNRSKEGKMEILPILLEPARLKDLEIASTFQITPGRPTPISEYFETSENDWKKVRLEVIEAIENVIERVAKKRNPAKPQETELLKPSASKDRANESDADKQITIRETFEQEKKFKGEDIIQSSSEKQNSLTDSINETSNHFITKKGNSQKSETSEKIENKDKLASSNSELFLYAKNAIYFTIGAKDSKTRSFNYIAGTMVQYSKNGDMGTARPWYQLPGYEDKDIWLTEVPVLYVDNKDNRTYFKILETGHVGYLVDIWEDWKWFYSSCDKISIDENLLGVIDIKLNQIISMTGKKGEIHMETKESGILTGRLRKMENYNCSSFTMGPCLVTCDSVIALVRTNRIHPITIKQVSESEKPQLVTEHIYWDRSQLKFRLQGRDALGFFDENILDQYIQFTEQKLGWMRIGISQIKRLTVDRECKEIPVVVETFTRNVYRGVCTERFNLSGTMLSFDNVKNLVLEACDRET